MEKFLITAALPYAESIPHLGNLTGSILPADVFYKYLVMNKADAIFICGSDEHGSPIEIQAFKKGIEPKELADKMHKEIKSVLEKFECSFSYYGETNSDSNREMVNMIFELLYKNGYIVETEETVPYCNIDKRVLSDRFIEGTCPYCGSANARGDQCDDCGHLLDPTQLINPHCKICGGSDISFIKSKNLAIDLKKLAPQIKRFIEQNKANNWSRNAVNKALSYIEQGLQPRDITRDLSWGFPVSMKGYETKKFYVWFDALIGYIGITKEWNNEKWKDYWIKSPETKLIQFMGKDNIEFHTLMWPGILIGTDYGFTLPHTIKAFEYLNLKGGKFSKSRGTGLTTQEALEILPAEYWRFVLMYVLPETADTEFSISMLVETIDNVLNNKIGNMLHRIFTFVKSNREVFENRLEKNITEKEILKLIDRYNENFMKLNIREALKTVVELAENANLIISRDQPWSLLKEEKTDQDAQKKLLKITSTLVHAAYAVSIMLWPFMPKASENALSHFGINGTPTIDLIEKEININFEAEAKPLFSKLTEREIKMLEKYSI
ncbi:MAG: methionine--tRNA ligase [Candidatus Micrarchaeia archaeon]